MTIWLPLTFAIAALIYSSVGFGGGSTYTAILLVSDIEIILVPLISLCCNIVVTGGGVLRAQKADLYKNSNILTLLTMSVPLAFLGGLTPINTVMLTALLACTLLLSGIQMMFASIGKRVKNKSHAPRHKLVKGSLIGGVTGYISGIVGIGGGIFLSPILHMLNWSSPRKIAAISSAYIAANSLAALIGKLVSLQSHFTEKNIYLILILMTSVGITSWIGHKFMIGILPDKHIKRLTAILIIAVAVRLLFSLFQG